MARFGTGGPSAGFGSISSGNSATLSTSNQASPGQSTPGSPNAADGLSGSTMGASGGSAPAGNASPATSTPGGTLPSVAPSSNPGRPGGESGERSLSESISGSGNARESFSYDSSAVRSQFEAAMANEFAEGEASPLVNPAGAVPQDRQPRPDYIAAETDSIQAGQLLANEASDDSMLAEAGTSLLGAAIGVPFLGIVKDLAENRQAGNQWAAENQRIINDRNLAPSSLETNTDTLTDAVTQSLIADSTGGFLGNDNALVEGATGRLDTVDNPSDPKGNAYREEVLVDRSPQEAAPSSESEFDFGIANVINYASYARDVFSII